MRNKKTILIIISSTTISSLVAGKVIKERNMPITLEEETLFNIMEEKYSNGQSSVCYNPCASKTESGVASLC